MSGIPGLVSRAFCSAQARSLTKLRKRASLRAPWFLKMASLTCVAISLRKFGWRRVANEGARFSDGNMRSAKVRSRSSRNWGFVGALGASCDVANSSAGVMSASGVNVHLRINSTSCKRNREKWREGFSSNICRQEIMSARSQNTDSWNKSWKMGPRMDTFYVAHTEDWRWVFIINTQKGIWVVHETGIITAK